MQGRRERITWGEFQSLYDLHDEGTFMAKGGLWHKMENDLVDIQNEGLDLIDEMSEANMLYNENKRAFALREHEFGGHGNVRARSVFFFKKRKIAEIARKSSGGQGRSW